MIREEKSLRPTKLKRMEAHQRNPEDAPVTINWFIFLQAQHDKCDAYYKRSSKM